MNKNIFEIRDYLKENNYIQSDAQFSKVYLNRSKKFLSVIKSKSLKVKENSILHLSMALKCKADIVRKFADDDQNVNADQLEEYSEMLIRELIPTRRFVFESSGALSSE
jgi:hypothetical protein